VHTVWANLKQICKDVADWALHLLSKNLKNLKVKNLKVKNLKVKNLKAFSWDFACGSWLPLSIGDSTHCSYR
jgi:hypothetical protein